MLSWHDKPGKTVVLDFDGVLHSYVSDWTGVEPQDDPVPGAQDFCRRLLSEGYKVAVVSTRCREPQGVQAVTAWLVRHDFPMGLFVTCEKVPAVAYVDDRAVHFDTSHALASDRGGAAWSPAWRAIQALAGRSHGAG